MYKLGLIALIVLLVACDNRPYYAPVVELKWKPSNPHQTTHRVKPGETVYSIAFRYDQDYKQLARLNHLQEPFTLRIGQILGIRTGFMVEKPKIYKPFKSASKQVTKIVKRPLISNHSLPVQKERIKYSRGQKWLWPYRGQIKASFRPQQGKKGIDIAGKQGEKIHSAADGIVAYAGSGLSGYGNLIIIKHNDRFLTAYGNNAKNIVKEGQKVKAGQIIAEMGIIDRNFWGVHFEIRKDGQPVNPAHYLAG